MAPLRSFGEQEIEQVFRQLGLSQPDTTGYAGRDAYQPRVSQQLGYAGRTQYRGLEAYRAQTGETFLPPRLETMRTETPEAIEKHGLLAQFMYGAGSPVLSTLKRIGVLSESDYYTPDPQTTGEYIFYGLGSLVSWGALLKVLGLGKAAAAIGSRTAALAGGNVLAGKLGQSAALGSVFGAHDAWTREEPMGPQMLQSIGFAMAVGGAFHGAGKFFNKLGGMKPTTTTILKEQMKKKHPMLHTKDPDSMAKALHNVPEEKLAPAIKKIEQRARELNHPLPSQLNSQDVGRKIGVTYNNLKPADKAEWLVRSFKENPDKDSLLEPFFNLTETVRMGTLVQSATAGTSSDQISTILRGASPAKLAKTVDSIVDNKRVFGNLTSGHKFKLARVTGDSKLFKGLKPKDQIAPKTLGQQYERVGSVIKDLKRVNKNLLEKNKVTNASQLAIKERAGEVTKGTTQKYVDRQAVIQDLTWGIGDHVGNAVRGDPSVALPSLTAVRDTMTSKAAWKTIQQEVNKGKDLSASLDWHPEIKKFFARLSKEYPNKYYTNEHFLPAHLKKEFNSLVAKIEKAGGSPQTLHWDLMTFPIPKEVTKKNLMNFVMKQKTPPEGLMHVPMNMQESLTLQRDVLPFFSKLSPIRYLFGEGFTTSARSRVQMHQKFVNTQMKKVEDWYSLLGVRPGKMAAEAGRRIGHTLEGRVPQNVDSMILPAAKKLATFTKEAPRGAELQELSKTLGLPQKTVLKIHRDLIKVFGNKGAMEEFQKIGLTQGRYAAQHIYTQKLFHAGTLKGEKAVAAAKELGLKNTQELKTAYQMRRTLDNIFREAGLDANRYYPGYLPHFRNMDGKSYNQVVSSLKEMGIKEKTAKGYLWVNEMPREGTTLNYEEDAFKAFAKYITGYSKKKHFDDLFETWTAHFKKTRLAPQRMKAYEDMQHWMVGRPGNVEQQMDALIYRFADGLQKAGWNPKWGTRPTAEMSAMLAELQYMGGLGFNPFTAIKNLTQKGLALSSITDDGNPLHGLQFLMRARAFKKTAEGKFVLGHNKIVNNRMFVEGLDAQHGAIERFLRHTGRPMSWSTASGKVRDKAFNMFRKSDISNVEDTFLAKYLYLTNVKGAPLADAVNMATQTTMATQFMYGFDSPLLYKGPFGRQLGVFMSWPINWAHLLYQQGSSGEVHRAVTTIGMYALGAEVLSLTGMNFKSISPVNTARNILPIAMLEGEQQWPAALRVGTAGLEYMRALVEGDPLAIDAAIENLKRRTKPLVPLGTMPQRAWDFIDVAKHEWKKYDDRGRLMYDVTPGEAARSLLGPTIESHQRYEDWKRGSDMINAYRHMRGEAVDAFMAGDYELFMRLQEQLVLNFGKWIEPQDIQQETRLRELSARERQLMALPAEMREPFIERHGR